MALVQVLSDFAFSWVIGGVVGVVATGLAVYVMVEAVRQFLKLIPSIMYYVVQGATILFLLRVFSIYLNKYVKEDDLEDFVRFLQRHGFTLFERVSNATAVGRQQVATATNTWTIPWSPW